MHFDVLTGAYPGTKWVFPPPPARPLASNPSGPAGSEKALTPAPGYRPPVAGFFRDETSKLTCDGVSLAAIAEAVGTPVYVYSRASIEESFRRFDAAFASVPHLVCYATKANSNLAILRVLAGLSAGADVVSGGELRAALECGFPAGPDRLLRRRQDGGGDPLRPRGRDPRLQRRVRAGDREDRRGSRRPGATARVALRVNPDIDPKSHPYISTGLKHNKFGVDIGRALEIYERARGLPAMRMTGIQAHIGSQITDPRPLGETARELALLAHELLARGFPLETLDVGGGIGIANEEGPGLSPESYASAVLPHVSHLPLKVLIEPGRAIVGPAGALVTRVLYRKQNGGREFVVTDAGMNDLIRPPLYGAIHPIEPVGVPPARTIVTDVVGPVCETSDFFARDIRLPAPEEGALLAIRDAGAYGFAMSSNYNFRGRAAEVLVEDGGFRVVRRRETFEDLVRLEREEAEARDSGFARRGPPTAGRFGIRAGLALAACASRRRGCPKDRLDASAAEIGAGRGRRPRSGPPIDPARDARYHARRRDRPGGRGDRDAGV